MHRHSVSNFRYYSEQFLWSWDESLPSLSLLAENVSSTNNQTRMTVAVKQQTDITVIQIREDVVCSVTSHALPAIQEHTHPFSGPFSGTTRVSRYQKGKTDLDFTEAGFSEWQWNQLGRMQVCNSLQTDNHASTPPLSFLQAGCQPTASKH